MSSPSDVQKRSPVVAVLTACVYAVTDPDAESVLRAAIGRVRDWDGLTASAIRHGMVGLLHRRVRTTCPEAVPSAVLELWRSHCIGLARRSLRMQRSLISVMDAFAASGVHALVFKGAAISEQIYGDSTLRHFSDLDVVVHPQSVRLARDVAHGLGYEDVASVWLTAEGCPEAASGEQEIELQHPVSRIWLEVHWRIGPRFEEHSLRAADLFDRADEVELLGRRIQCLGCWDVLLSLVMHAGAHEWLRIEDVAALNTALNGLNEAEAQELEAFALANGCLRRLRIGVALASSIAPSKTHTDLQVRALSDSRAVRLARAARGRLLDSLGNTDPAEEVGPMRRAKSALWEARSLDSRLEAAHYVLRRLFGPTVYDYDGPRESARGLAGRLATQVRRQRRLWRRDRT